MCVGGDRVGEMVAGTADDGICVWGLMNKWWFF